MSKIDIQFAARIDETLFGSFVDDDGLAVKASFTTLAPHLGVAPDLLYSVRVVFTDMTYFDVLTEHEWRRVRKGMTQYIGMAFYKDEGSWRHCISKVQNQLDGSRVFTTLVEKSGGSYSRNVDRTSNFFRWLVLPQQD